MALYRKGQAPDYRDAFRIMRGEGWDAVAARYAMHGTEPVIYIDADTPYAYGGEKVKARGWTSSGVGERRGADVMLYVERNGQPSNLEDVSERATGSRAFTLDAGGREVPMWEAVDEASAFLGAASHYPFVCSLEDYRLTYERKADLMRQLGGSADPEKGYEIYLDHCVRDLTAGDMVYIGAVRTPRQAQSMLDDHRQYMDEKSGEGPVHDAYEEEAQR